MSVNDFTTTSRRGFLRNALGAVASPFLPRGLIGELSNLADAAPNLAGYILKKVPKKILPFMSTHIDGWAFLNDAERKDTDTYIDLLSERSASIFPTTDIFKTIDFISTPPISQLLSWYVASFDSRVTIPEEIEDGVPFKIGHLIEPENASHYWWADYVFCTPDEDELAYMKGEGLERFQSHLAELKEILAVRTDLGGIENVAAMRVKDFWENVSKPIYREKLRILVSLKLSPGSSADLGEELYDFDDRLLDGLKKELPEYADTFDQALKNYEFREYQSDAHKINPAACVSYPAGHFRLEKQGMGAYRLHAPQIL